MVKSPDRSKYRVSKKRYGIIVSNYFELSSMLKFGHYWDFMSIFFKLKPRQTLPKGRPLDLPKFVVKNYNLITSKYFLKMQICGIYVLLKQYIS